MIGAGKITLEDFVGVSGRVSIYSSSDDYTGMAMSNPTVPEELTKVTSLPVLIKSTQYLGLDVLFYLKSLWEKVFQLEHYRW